VGGARTYRGLVGTAEISGGLQASQNELGMHTILGTRPPSEPYSLGALTPPTPSPYSRDRDQSRERITLYIFFSFAECIHNHTPRIAPRKRVRALRGADRRLHQPFKFLEVCVDAMRGILAQGMFCHNADRSRSRIVCERQAHLCPV
jgi:hypothetical protein